MEHHQTLSQKRRLSGSIERSRKCRGECNHLIRHFNDRQKLSKSLAIEIARIRGKVEHLKQDRNLDGVIDKSELAAASSYLSRRGPLGGGKGNGISALLEFLARAIEAIVTEARRSNKIADLHKEMRTAYQDYYRRRKDIDRLISDTIRIRKNLGCTDQCVQGL